VIHAQRMNTDSIDPAELDAYDAWLAEHLDELVRRHPGKVVAVSHDGVIAVGDSYREVFAAAAAQGIAEPLTLRVPNAEEANAVFPSVFSARRE
jgi:broad specificity phosphatase PhoE